MRSCAAAGASHTRVLRSPICRRIADALALTVWRGPESVLQLYRDFSGSAKADFLAKIRALDDIGLDDLAILFDDTRGDVPDLAAREAVLSTPRWTPPMPAGSRCAPPTTPTIGMLDVVFGKRPVEATSTTSDAGSIPAWASTGPARRSARASSAPAT